MQIKLPYGKKIIPVDIPGDNVTVIEPRFIEGFPDEERSFTDAVRSPINTRPLREIVKGRDRIAVLVPDITRPFPSHRILPWLFNELANIPAGNFSIIIGTGSHRANTRAELVEMLGAEIAARYQIVVHDSQDLPSMLPAGNREDGGTVYLNREYVSADKRIIMGFIEPHFMAGFSGGYKAVMPGVADIDSILYYHRASIVGDPRSTWGVLQDNPTRQLVQKFGALVPADFCLNVTLNRKHWITGFFCGDPVVAHLKGCEFSKASVMVPCLRRFPVVITTNGGYPLDQNLYQSVKGISAAAQIVEDDGLIVAVCECADGFPAHGNFAKILFDHNSPQAILDTVLKPGFSIFDQWEAQLLAMIQVRAKVALFSSLPSDEVRRAHLEPVADLDEYIASAMRKLGENAPVAVLPEGPQTIPYLV